MDEIGRPVARSNNTTVSGETQWTGLDMSGVSLRCLSPNLFNYQFLMSLDLSKNQLLTLPPDINKLVNLTNLDVSNNRLRSLPAEIGDMVPLRELNLANNNLATLPFELGGLFQLQKLSLAGNPLGDPLLRYAQESTSALLTFLLDHATIGNPPPERPWIATSEASNSDQEGFTVLCYNVLCDKYATRQLYGYCPTWALNWDYRKKKILEEVITYNADILCLQEVASEHFYDFFLPELQQRSYEGIFKPKSRARTMSDEQRKYVDGCAIFYNTQKFTLVKDHLVEFNQLATSSMSDFSEAKDMLNRVMTKDNIAVMALLESRATGSLLFVSNVHIHWDPSFKDVKLVQTAMLTDELRKVMEETRKGTPLIVCGDFNSLPDSGVFEFMEQGRVSSDHADLDTREYGSFARHGIRHNFKFKSACSTLPFTNFTWDFSGVIDYVWYTADNLTCAGFLGKLSEDYTQNLKGFPNPHCPSDHIPLLVEFKFQPQFQRRGIL